MRATHDAITPARKWGGDKMTRWQGDKMTRWQDDKVTQVRPVILSSLHPVILSSCHPVTTQPLRKEKRLGLTFLEVMIACAIFLLSITVLYQLVSRASNKALSVQKQAKATQLCQAKLAEFVSGVLPLQQQSGSFDSADEEPDWQWTADCTDANVPNLWSVTVTVSKEFSDGTKAEVVLSQLVLDPAQRGSSLDSVSTTSGSGTTTGGTP